MAASYNVSVVIRQSFIGGNYGLVDTKSLDPTPVSSSILVKFFLVLHFNQDLFIYLQNYWISYIFKKIVGKTVLKVQTTSSSFIRLYAHCYKRANLRRHSIVIFGMNLGSSNYKDFIVKHDNLTTFPIAKYILTGANDQLTSRCVSVLYKVNQP